MFEYFVQHVLIGSRDQNGISFYELILVEVSLAHVNSFCGFHVTV